MKIMSQTKARKDFFKIAKEVNEDSVPVIATNKDSLDDVVILGKADGKRRRNPFYFLRGIYQMYKIEYTREFQKDYMKLKQYPSMVRKLKKPINGLYKNPFYHAEKLEPKWKKGIP